MGRGGCQSSRREYPGRGCGQTDRRGLRRRVPDTAIKFPYGWTVRFDFREHLETGDRALAPFSSVVVVPHDGTEPHFAPTALPAHEYLAL
jgi:hypothetical protein